MGIKFATPELHQQWRDLCEEAFRLKMLLPMDPLPGTEEWYPEDHLNKKKADAAHRAQLLFFKQHNLG